MGTYKYPAEFRADAVALVRSLDHPVSQSAKELGVNHETLRQWVKAADAADAAGGRGASSPAAAADPAKDAEIARLRRQVRELEMERDIMRKAAKYFATETNW
ncbi:transposase [Streptomyces sp. SID8352]|uniref:transposase n=1 Tax=Streptomyces sp. SID8352 TaxID=2690338 RepID=UPI00136B0589|nr:transposase [Streptomyces sp. SID8352]